MNEQGRHEGVSRRGFMKGAAVGAVSLAAASPFNPRAFAAGSDKIRVGLIGCGGRGTYDTGNCLKAAESVELVAMGDMFQDRLDRCRQSLSRSAPDKVKVTDDKCFVGWDAHKKVLATDVNLVILTQPPHFRPSHLKAAVEAGKHVFMEKPVAVDPAGVRSVIQSSELADTKGLTILAGTQMRRISHAVEAAQRVHDGALGEILGGQCVRLGDAMRSCGGGHAPAVAIDPRLLQLTTLAERSKQGPPARADRLEMFFTGEACYAALEKAIAEARHHVHLEYYIWGRDQVGTRFRDLLCDKARSGVHVRFLVDAIGSSRLNRRFLKPMRQAGVEVAWFNPITLARLRPGLVNFRTHPLERIIVTADLDIAP